MRLFSCLKVRLHSTVCNTASWLISSKFNLHTTIWQRRPRQCVQLHLQWNKTGCASITHRFSLMETKWLERLKAECSREKSLWLHFYTMHVSDLTFNLFIENQTHQHSKTAQDGGDSHTLSDARVCLCVCCIESALLLWHSAPLQAHRMCVNDSPLKLVGHCSGIHIKQQLGAEVAGAADKDTRFWAAEHHGVNGPDPGC